jgi:hypothetical protein
MPFPLRSALPVGVVAVAVAVLAILPAGCGTDAATDKPAVTTTQQSQTDPWTDALAELKADADPATCRRVLSRLGAELSAAPAADQLAGLSADGEKALRAVMPLTDEDLAEVRPAGFTPLDGAYLSDCLYLADAARVIDPPDPTPARRAEAAFAWVCRQVEPRPWLILVNQSALSPALPPTAVLRRGSGSGLERAYVFLALLQQFGIDGCLIGGPKSGGQPSAAPFPATSTGVPRGPFWAVGARVGADVLVFDPWRGEPLPGPDGRIATLAGITANPNVLKPWFDDKTNPWGVTVDNVKEATAYFALPLNAAAPRVAVLEKKLTAADRPVRLATDPVALQARFASEAKLPGLTAWNPAHDPFALSRTLATYLPTSEGGKDPGKVGERIQDRYKAELLPPSVFAIPEGVNTQETAKQLVGLSANRFATAFLVDPTPREQMQRGAYFKASSLLVDQRRTFADARERARTDRNREQAVRKWVQEANEVSANVGRRRLDAKQNPEALADAQAQYNRFWSGQSLRGDGTTGMIVDAAVAEAGLAEATYLLALCKHEQAEAAQARADSARGTDELAERAKEQAKEAWAEAQNWWSQYAPLAPSQEQGFPGRTRQSGRLAARAEKMAAVR